MKKNNSLLGRDESAGNTTIFKSKTPRFRVKDIIVPASTENEIRDALVKVQYQTVIYEKWGFGQIDPVGRGCVLNFYGPPGTGKTRAAEGLAGELAIPFLKVDLAELESKFMGDTAKNLKEMFSIAKTEGALLFFDEADTVLGKRLSSVTQGIDAEINLTRSTMLMEMDDHAGVLCFASNFPENYDAAFRRRISHHVRFDLPDMEARRKIWNLHLVTNIPVEGDRDLLLDELAGISEGLSGGYILQAMRLALPKAINREDLSASMLKLEHVRDAVNLVHRGIREVGSDVNERLGMTREMFGLKKN